MGKFQDLKVWQRGKNLAVFVYRITSKHPFTKDYGLRDQIRRATVSIPSNIAEGNDLRTDKQAIRHFYIARASAAEVFTQAIIALEIGYLGQEAFDYIEEECRRISAMLTRLIQSRTRSNKKDIP
ncbi:MAG: four helix bundle protein [Deltaproteobacteria bacterium]|nr:four helix bundle protein [Deltaproteobacteria bacterium]MBW2071654.1 four helix bundle protein [Deltaproteobacteria bacterium]